jgi:hypothetical protein
LRDAVPCGEGGRALRVACSDRDHGRAGTLPGGLEQRRRRDLRRAEDPEAERSSRSMPGELDRRA